MEQFSKPRPHDVYGRSTYTEPLDADLDAAQFSVLVQSPYITFRGIERWKIRFQTLINRGVRVCTFVLPPEEWHNGYERDPVAAGKVEKTYREIEGLRSMGVHVTIFRKIHDKVVVIDGKTLWDGSVNSLSWNDTTERINRFADPKLAIQAVTQHRLDACAQCMEEDSVVNRRVQEDLIVTLDTLGQLISLRRRALGMTQRELYMAASLNKRTLRTIENGKTSPTMDTVMRIFSQLDLTLLAVPNHVVPYVHDFVAICPREQIKRTEG